MRHLRTVSLLVIIFNFLLAVVQGQGLEKKLPNIIYIMADDLGIGDLSCYGQKILKTPHIDRLAANGMKFTQHYSGSTVCAPTRSVLMTGKHTGNASIRDNTRTLPFGQEPLPARDVTVAEVLKARGYATGCFGKWGLGNADTEGAPLRQGFDKFVGFYCQHVAHFYYPLYIWEDDKMLVLEGNSSTSQQTYAPDVIHQKTLEFIEENKDRPFFAYVPSIIPHASMEAPEEYMAKYRGKFLPEKSHTPSRDPFDDYLRGIYVAQPDGHAAFAAMIEILDTQVGEIVSKLEELGIAENTLIIFTSDNGAHKEGGADPEYFDSNGPFRGLKRDMYEGGIRAPMIATWPGRIQAGTTSDHISAHWDVLPTLAQLAGSESPADINGISFVPTLLGGKQEKHEYLYWEFSAQGGKVAVRKDNWKAVRLRVRNNPDAPIELYDLSVDIGETNDIAAEHPDIVAEMRHIMYTARTESGRFPIYSGEKPRSNRGY